jgi:hypothetical protein
VLPAVQTLNPESCLALTLRGGGADGAHPEQNSHSDAASSWRVGDSALASRFVESRERIVCSTVRV